jgi:hypothetical protein
MIPKVLMHFFIIKDLMPTFGIMAFGAVPPKLHLGACLCRNNPHTPWKNNCHLISSDITQLWLQLQSYSIPTLDLILVFLILILKKFSKKWASAQCLLQ